MKNRVRVVTVLVAAAVALMVYRVWLADTAAHRVQRSWRMTLGSREYPSSKVAGGDSTAFLVQRFYAQRRYAPVWSDGLHLASGARELVAVLDSAAAEGLEPEDYLTPRLRQLLVRTSSARLARAGDSRLLAELDLGLTAGFLRYASDLFDGRVDPRRLPAE